MMPFIRFLSRGRAALATLFLLACDPQPPAVVPQPQPLDHKVSIAANMPLTGALAVYGTDVRDGAQLGLDRLDQPGDGVELNIDWQDNASEARTAVTVAQRQLMARPQVYVSGVKPQVMAISGLMRQQPIPHFVWIFDAFINADNPAANNFRTWVGYRYEPQVYLDYARQRGASRVAVCYVQLPHTEEEFQKLVLPGLQALEPAPQVEVQPYAYGKSDFKDVAASFARFKPDLVILNGFQGELVSQVRALRTQGLAADGQIIGTYDMMDAATILSPVELEGVRQVVPRFMLAEDEERKAFERDFQVRFGRPASYTAAYAYDMVRILHDAARRLPVGADMSAWRQAILATDLQGLTGPLTFTSDGDLLTPLAVGVYRQGALVLDAGSRQK